MGDGVSGQGLATDHTSNSRYLVDARSNRGRVDKHVNGLSNGTIRPSSVILGTGAHSNILVVGIDTA